jgi:BioD-like phosphotransacetylase family protein
LTALTDSKIHDLIVKIRPDDTEKIRLVQELIAKHVKLDKILEAL